MTLTELKARVEKAIEQNERYGWKERNQMPILIRVNRTTPKGRYKSRFFPLSEFWISQMGVAGEQYGAVACASEKEEVRE